MNTAAPRARPLVLIVEDDADSREMYAIALQMGGFEVEAAADAATAFDIAARVQPIMIVTDFMLRGSDNGAALCRKLHADPRTAGIPVLVLTGSTRKSDAEALLGAGCGDIRTKPYLPEALVADVQRVAGPQRGPHARAS